MRFRWLSLFVGGALTLGAALPARAQTRLEFSALPPAPTPAVGAQAAAASSTNEHLRRAAEHLDAAGQRGLAEQVRRLAGASERERQREIHELQADLRRLQQQLAQLNAETSSPVFVESLFATIHCRRAAELGINWSERLDEVSLTSRPETGDRPQLVFADRSRWNALLRLLVSQQAARIDSEATTLVPSQGECRFARNPVADATPASVAGAAATPPPGGRLRVTPTCRPQGVIRCQIQLDQGDRVVSAQAEVEPAGPAVPHLHLQTVVDLQGGQALLAIFPSRSGDRVDIVAVAPELASPAALAPRVVAPLPTPAVAPQSSWPAPRPLPSPLLAPSPAPGDSATRFEVKTLPLTRVVPAPEIQTTNGVQETAPRGVGPY